MALALVDAVVGRVGVGFAKLHGKDATPVIFHALTVPFWT